MLYKGLHDRRETPGQPGRILTEEEIAHYRRGIVTIKETMRLMGEIDETTEGHGRRPIE